MLDPYRAARDMPPTSRLIISKLSDGVQLDMIYRWALARYDATAFRMIILGYYPDLQGALMEVDNIRHSEEEGRF